MNSLWVIIIGAGTSFMVAGTTLAYSPELDAEKAQACITIMVESASIIKKLLVTIWGRGN